jgi:Zn finger protein HypA/HybF involved in hydrogenase expression
MANSMEDHQNLFMSKEKERLSAVMPIPSVKQYTWSCAECDIHESIKGSSSKCKRCRAQQDITMAEDSAHIPKTREESLQQENEIVREAVRITPTSGDHLDRLVESDHIEQEIPLPIDDVEKLVPSTDLEEEEKVEYDDRTKGEGGESGSVIKKHKVKKGAVSREDNVRREETTGQESFESFLKLCVEITKRNFPRIKLFSDEEVDDLAIEFVDALSQKHSILATTVSIGPHELSLFNKHLVGFCFKLGRCITLEEVSLAQSAHIINDVKYNIVLS